MPSRKPSMRDRSAKLVLRKASTEMCKAEGIDSFCARVYFRHCLHEMYAAGYRAGQREERKKSK